MKIYLPILAAASLLATPLLATADPITATYEIGSYSTPGFSASWRHEATGCRSTQADGDVLYMCGAVTGLTGTITGELDGGVLSGLGGSLSVGGSDYAISGGSLGGAFDWIMTVTGLGQFRFEDLGMAAGYPNSFDGNELILWGQNLAAYSCAPGEAACIGDAGPRWGLDVYAQRVSVPEPGTLALFGLGLAAAGFARRRSPRRQ